jgi:hypothetical protein
MCFFNKFRAFAFAVCLPAALTLATSSAWCQGQSTGAQSKTVTHPDSQDTSGTGDANRMDESYEPKGIDMAQFLLFPQVEAGSTWNSNIYANMFQHKSDFIETVSPQIRLQSRFDTHALNIFAGADHFQYSTYNSDTRTEGHGGLDGRLDITKETEATAYVDVYSRFEDRGSPTAVSSAATPTPTQGVTSKFGIKQVLSALTVSGNVGINRLTFDNVESQSNTLINNAYRNRTETSVVERADYEVIPGKSVVLQATENNRAYDSLDTLGLKRDSHGWRIESGLAVDITQLLKGDVLVGYMDQSYADHSFRSVNGYAAHVALNWTPTPLLLIVPSFDHEIQEGTQSGSSGMLHTAANVLVRQEILRNFIVTGFVSAYRDHYDLLGKAAMGAEAKLGASYAFIPELYVRLELDEKLRRSEVQGTGYDQSIITVRLGLRL